jgi:ATP-dependent Lon protease
MILCEAFKDPHKHRINWIKKNMDTSFFNIADPEEVRTRVSELKDQSREIRARLAPLLKKLWDPERELKIVDNLKGFAELRERFPNFSEVVDLFEANAIALSKVNQPFEAQPVLLCGEPGLGKTLFANELSRSLGLPYFEIALSTITASFALSGGSLQWENGNVGFVAKSLVDSEVGNPLFLIDELDKCTDGSKYNPISSFFSLLERHSACRFKDEALDISIDASKVVWIATANDMNNVPEAILSRMHVFDIERPDASGMRSVITSVYESLRRAKPYGVLLQQELDDGVINALTHLMPRGVRQTLEDAMLKAIMADRKFIIVDDLITGKKKGKQNVGFI